MRSLLTLAFVLIVTVLVAPSARSQPAPARAVDPLALPALESLQATRDRPLFTLSRRAPRTVVTDAPDPDDAPEEEVKDINYDLAGIVIGENIRVAVLRDKKSGETQKLRRGDTLDEWTLADVERRSVVLKRGAASVRLNLFTTDPSKKPQKPADEEEEEE